MANLKWTERFLCGYCNSNHDNVVSTGLPASTVRGFTILHNTMNQNDLEALFFCVVFQFWKNFSTSKEESNTERKKNSKLGDNEIRG